MNRKKQLIRIDHSVKAIKCDFNNIAIFFNSFGFNKKIIV